MKFPYKGTCCLVVTAGQLTHSPGGGLGDHPEATLVSPARSRGLNMCPGAGAGPGGERHNPVASRGEVSDKEFDPGISLSSRPFLSILPKP